jgi:type I restriction enzyme S subunit
MNESLPPNWETVPYHSLISEISVNGLKIKKSESKQSGLYPVIDQGQNYIGGYSDKKDKVLTITEPVIVFGDHTRIFKYVDFDFVPGADGIKVLKPKDNVHPKLFYYFSQVVPFKNRGYSRHFQFLKNANFNLPLDELEQTKIVGIIDELFSLIDKEIQQITHVITLVKQYKKSLLKDACSGQLTSEWRSSKAKTVNCNNDLELIENDRKFNWPKVNTIKYKEPVKADPLVFSVPNQWSVASCDKISIKITDGAHHTPVYKSFGIPFISVKDIRDGQISFENCKYISEETHQLLIRRCFPEMNDLLITKSGTIGRTAVVNTNKQFSLFVSVALVKPGTPLVLSKWIEIVINNYIQSIDVKQRIKGGVIKNLHIEDIRKIAIPIPSLEEQELILSVYQRKVSVANKSERDLQQLLNKIEAYKHSILKQAFEGKLR